jgi:hypothetical protein
LDHEEYDDAFTDIESKFRQQLADDAAGRWRRAGFPDGGPEADKGNDGNNGCEGWLNYRLQPFGATASCTEVWNTYRKEASDALKAYDPTRVPFFDRNVLP